MIKKKIAKFTPFDIVLDGLEQQKFIDEDFNMKIIKVDNSKKNNKMFLLKRSISNEKEHFKDIDEIHKSQIINSYGLPMIFQLIKIYTNFTNLYLCLTLIHKIQINIMTMFNQKKFNYLKKTLLYSLELLFFQLINFKLTRNEQNNILQFGYFKNNNQQFSFCNTLVCYNNQSIFKFGGIEANNKPFNFVEEYKIMNGNQQILKRPPSFSFAYLVKQIQLKFLLLEDISKKFLIQKSKQ
ncbi:unnamed protein product [Paramecium sonneborni]|uniref:Uncharacterized protein n=1 Tax=Paramecium sonneborni TaxID=65129 RepID=A0A8S1QGM7_9CILI|nr:unnamed protein product [Paramecium sonneborni]